MNEPASEDTIKVYDVIYHCGCGLSLEHLEASTGLHETQIIVAVAEGIGIGWLRMIGSVVYTLRTDGTRMQKTQYERTRGDVGAYMPTPEDIAEHCRKFRDETPSWYDRQPHLPKPGDYRIPGSQNGKEWDQ